MNHALRAVATGQAQHTEASEFSALLNRTFDPAIWHAMQERDDALVRDAVLHGTASKAFVYSFPIKGSTVTGVSVVGARELAAQYKGLKSRIVATVEKTGSLFVFRTFSPKLEIETRQLHDLASEPDFYECVLEVEDIKAGSSIQVRKKERKVEADRNGNLYERPHFDVIAESKAFRNAILSLLPQSVVLEFKTRCLKAGDGTQEKTIDQLRAGAQQFAAKHGIGLDRKAVEALSYAEMMGLGGAAANGVEQFKASALALGIVSTATGEVGAPAAPAPAKGGKASKAAPKAEASASAQQSIDPGPGGDGPTVTYAQLADAITKAKGRDDAAQALDDGRGLPDDQRKELSALFERTWKEA